LKTYDTSRAITDQIFCLLIIIIIWESLQKFALHRINIQAFDTRSKLIYTPMCIVTYATSRVITEPIFCILIIIIIWEFFNSLRSIEKISKPLLRDPYATSRVIMEPIFCLLIIIIIWESLQKSALHRINFKDFVTTSKLVYSVLSI
jgi:hypothetical protein